MEEGKLDLIFAGPEAENGTLLWEEELAWTGPGEMKEIPSEKESIDLVLMPAPCSYRQIAFDSLTNLGQPWQLSMQANSVQAVQSTIRAGLGVSVLPRSAVAEDLSFLIGDSLPELPNTSVMCYERPGPAHPYARRLIDYLMASIEERS
jgi:DNA-binding transcriptional LysR family regulator